MPARLPAFPSPASSQRSWMCSNRLKFYFILKRVFRSKLFLLVPVPDRPIAQIRRVRQFLPRIHHVPMPHRIQHRPVQQGIPVRVRLAQIDLHRPRHHFHCSPLRFPKIRFAQHTPRKHPRLLLQPRRAHQNVALHSPRLQLALQRHRHHPRQWLHHPAHQSNLVSAPRVPFHARHSFFEKRNRLHRFQNLLNPQSPQVTLIPLRDRGQPSRQQLHRLHSPPRVIHPRNRAPSPQRPKQSPLQRRLRHQRPVNIEKRPNPPLLFPRAAHPASPRASSPVLVADKLPARTLQPSTSTGRPRTTQKTPVIHASVCAPARIAACMSSVTGPNRATGPRVSASSNPK